MLFVSVLEMKENEIQNCATLLSHISNLNKYSAPSQCFDSGFSFESSLSAQRMWIWGFAPILLLQHLRKAILNSLRRFFLLVSSLSFSSATQELNALFPQFQHRQGCALKDLSTQFSDYGSLYFIVLVLCLIFCHSYIYIATLVDAKIKHD